MSRGYGSVQREALRVLASSSLAWMELPDLARAVFGPHPKESQEASLRRALARLVEDGIVDTEETVSARPRQVDLSTIVGIAGEVLPASAAATDFLGASGGVAGTVQVRARRYRLVSDAAS